MEKSTITTVCLTASDGMTITNADNSVLSKKMYLGIYDSPDNYYEIPDKEAEQIRADQEEAVKKQMEEERINQIRADKVEK